MIFANTPRTDHVSHSSCYFIESGTLEQTCEFCTPKFPYYTELCLPHLYPGRTYPWHWHKEVQFFCILDGFLEYELNSGTYRFEAGDGGYINSNILHSLRPLTGRTCSFIELLFRPSFVGGAHQSIIYTKYVQPVTDNNAFDIFRLNGTDETHGKILSLIRETHQLYKEKPPYYEMMIRERTTRMWTLLFSASEAQRNAKQPGLSSVRLKNMMLFINQNYRRKISLDEIAETGMCSRRECSRTFRSELHMTPFGYLRQIRLNHACDLLQNTTEPITNICLDCGFPDNSYFTRIFREQIGVTPKQYRAGGGHFSSGA